MCWAIVVTETFLVAGLAYLRWEDREDLQYWRARSRELADQLKHVSESRLMEIIEAKSKHFESGMTVEFNDNGQT